MKLITMKIVTRVKSILLMLFLYCGTIYSQKYLHDKKNGTVSPAPVDRTIFNPESIDFSASANKSSITAKYLIKSNLGEIYTCNLLRTSEFYIWCNVSKNEGRSLQSLPNTQNQVETRSTDFLLSLIHTHFQNKDYSAELKSTEKDELGIYHCKYQLYFKNIKIYGAEVNVQSSFSEIKSCMGFFPHAYHSGSFNLPNKTITELDAISIAKKQLEIEHSHDSFYLNGAHAFSAIDIEKQLYFDFQHKPRLIFLITAYSDVLHRHFLFLDAETGTAIELLDGTCTANGPKTTAANDLNGNLRTINTYEYNSLFYMMDASRSMYKSGSIPSSPSGVIWTLNANNTDASGNLAHNTSTNNSSWNSTAVSAQFNAEKCYEYFLSTHSRNSIDGNGGNITSVINVTDGIGSMDNAYWNGQFMAYGNGKNAFKPLAGSLDVGGHEMTHGVVEKTANLEYKGQSGAINESMADIFGCMIDRDDWLLGEDVVKISAYPSGALRSLQNPHNGGASLGQNGYQPRVMAEFYTGTQDNGGVHINSGIPNWAYYKFATATSKEIAEKVYYRALTLYLTKTSQFLDLRYAIVKAASDLHGANSNVVSAAKTAFDEVQIYDPNAGSGGSGGGTGAGGTYELPANNGTELILSYDLNNDDLTTYYSSTSIPNNFQGISNSEMRRRPSVTDDGLNAYYVHNNLTLRCLSPTNSFADFNVQSQTIWNNVAISKDGKLLAGVTVAPDTSIYVYNFALQQWKRFKLYNPTYSGVASSGVYEVDAIEFDHSGENIIYDAGNKVKLNSGETVDYWDIGIINVWNFKANNWGTGEVQKLFNQLPADISVGNPVYSKNSPHIVAFDYIDAGSNINAVLGFNLNTNKSGTIAISERLTFPCFSRLDDKLLYDDEDLSGNGIIKIVNLNSNKIQGISGTEKDFIELGKWSSWITLGTRRLRNNEKSILSFGFPQLIPAVSGTINGLNINITVPGATDVSNLIPTFTNSPASVVSVSNITQTSGTNAQNFSSIVSYKVTAQDNSSQTYTVTVNKLASINDKKGFNKYTIMPNPAIANMILNTTCQDLIVQDMIGKTYNIVSSSDNQITKIETSNLPIGNYILKFKKDGVVYAQRFTKR